MTDSKGEKTEFPAMGISVNAQYAAGRQIVFQLHMPLDVTEEGLNKIFDKMNSVVDRAEAFYAQEQARRQLEIEERATAGIARRLNDVEDNMRLKAVVEGKYRNSKPSPSDEMAKKQALDTLEEGKRRVAEAKKFLLELIVKAGNRDGARSSADH